MPPQHLDAIRAAVCQGYAGVILDVQVTSDGVAVLGKGERLPMYAAKSAMVLRMQRRICAKRAFVILCIIKTEFLISTASDQLFG